MSQSELLVKSLLFYFLPKLAIYLPLAWVALCFWWTKDTSADQSGCLEEQLPETRRSPAVEEDPWYQSLLGGTQEQRRPGSDWL
jgi:hypothetical protein